jgi:hypothetical protein
MKKVLGLTALILTFGFIGVAGASSPPKTLDKARTVDEATRIFGKGVGVHYVSGLACRVAVWRNAKGQVWMTADLCYR